MSDDSWLDKAKNIQDDGLVGCGNCGNRFPFIELKKYKINGKQIFACSNCIKDEKKRLKEEREKRTLPIPKKEVQTQTVEKMDTKPITENQDKIVSMLESIQEAIHDSKPSNVPRVGSLNLYLSPPSVESLFHLVRSSGKIVENDLCRSFGEYFTPAKYLVLEMRVRDYLWKDDHGWLMINPILALETMLELDPWYELHDPGDLDGYLNGLKQKAMRFKFKPVKLLSQIERTEMLRKVFSFNVDVDDDELMIRFENEYNDILALKPRSRKKSKKDENTIDEKIENLRRMLEEALTS